MWSPQRSDAARRTRRVLPGPRDEVPPSRGILLIGLVIAAVLLAVIVHRGAFAAIGGALLVAAVVAVIALVAGAALALLDGVRLPRGRWAVFLPAVLVFAVAVGGVMGVLAVLAAIATAAPFALAGTRIGGLARRSGR